MCNQIYVNLTFFCLRYFECNIKGEEAEKLCPDGLVFDIYTQNCDYPAKVDCSLRPELRKIMLMSSIQLFIFLLLSNISK